MNGVGGGGRSSGHDGTQQAAYPVPNHQQQQHSPVSNGHASNAAPSQPSSHNSGMSTASHFPAVYPQLLQRNPLSTVPQHGTSNGNSMDATSPLSPAPGSGTTATSLSSFPTMATSTSAPPVSGTTAFASSQGSGGYPSSMQSSTSMPQSQPTSHYTHSSMYGYSSHGSSTVAGSYSAYSSFVPGPGGLPIPGFGYGKGNGVLPPSSNGYASSTISAYNGLQPTLSESLAVVAPQQIMASRGRLPLGHSTQPARPQLSPELHCTCPMICVVATNHGAADALPLPIRNLQMQARCHISTAFVSVQLLCDYPAVWNEAPLVFFLPKTVDTTVTDILVENTVRPSMFVTAVVPLEDAKKYGLKKGSDGSPVADDVLDPEMLILPLPAGLPGDQYKVTLTYFHPMAFEDGRYVLRMPTTLPESALPQGASINGLLDINVTVNSGGTCEVDLTVASHPHTLIHSQPGSVALEADAERPWDNVDFVVGYGVWRDSITATVHVELPADEDELSADNPDARGSFCVSVSPPGPEASVAFPRSVIFMLDRSGSMVGEPIAFARTALINGLRMLGPQDEFSVVVFDHEQVWWTDKLVEATAEQVASCAKWIAADVTARGTTDIAGPLKTALSMLAYARYLPFVFLITDGCVEDERDICISMQAMMDKHAAAVAAAAASNAVNAAAMSAAGSEVLSQSAVSSAGTSVIVPPSPRVCTFGIGPYCNHYFLKQLATIGRGLFDVAFRPQAIQVQIERMMAASALPLLSDVTMSVQGLTSCELYPFPVPDLYCGQPLLVAGKYEGSWPGAIDLNGNLPNGAGWVQSVTTLPAGTLPLHKLFVKNQLDLMTAQAWLAGNPEHLVQRIVQLSVATGVQSAHTMTVGFESTPERYKAYKKLPDHAARNKRIKHIAIGGAAAVGIVGGVVLAIGFGSLLASLANAPVGDAMASADLGGMFGEMGGGCDCCGGDCCGGDCGGCDDCCHHCACC